MNLRVIFFTVISIFIFCNCSKRADAKGNLSSTKDIFIDPVKYWYLKDITLDSVAGISFEKASKYLKDEKVKDTVIVSVTSGMAVCCWCCICVFCLAAGLLLLRCRLCFWLRVMQICGWFGALFCVAGCGALLCAGNFW